MNALSPTASFDAQAERFDTYVARRLASTKATRHMRDRLIGEVHSGALDHLMLRAGEGLSALPEEVGRQAALNAIDFAFEPLVLPGLSVPQAAAYLRAVEDVLSVGEAAGLDGPGPLWVDTVHHGCVFSVLFQLAAYLRRYRGCDRIVLLHQGIRPEPRLDVVGNLLAKLHGMALFRLPLRGRWFHDLTRLTTPSAAIFSLADMPREAIEPPAGKTLAGRTLAGKAASGSRKARIALHAEPGIRREVETVSGSAAFARRLGASHVVLDYPAADRIRIAPFDPARAPACPLQDWVFWPVLAARLPAGSPTGASSRASSN